MTANAFGLSETGPVCSLAMREMPDFDGGLVPIGTPVECARVHLIGEDLRQVQPGETGQIAVISPGTAQGYWKKPDLTRERFVTHHETGERMCLSGDLGRELPDGQLLHLGREDNRVKIRGWSVDLGEVETALGAHPSVRDAAAAMRANRLVGYVVAKASSHASASALRRFVASRLPDYMVPFAIVTLDALPLTVSGKFDRKALPTPQRHRDPLTQPYVGPRTPVEEALSRVWADRLGLDRVGVEDNFFELGGDSLVVARVISAAAAAFGVGVPVDEFFSRPTVAGMAMAVVEHLPSNASIDVEAVLGQIETRPHPPSG